jgi:hypothetical protein
VGEFEPYYGPEMEEKLLRMDLVRQDPEGLAWLKSLGESMKSEVEFADVLQTIPQEVFRREQYYPNHFGDFLHRVKMYLQEIAKLRTPSQAKSAESGLRMLASESHGYHNQARWADPIAHVYMLRRDLKEVSRYLELMQSLNSRFEGFDKSVNAAKDSFEKGAAASVEEIKHETQKIVDSFEAALKESIGKLDSTLEEATKYKEKTKQQYEESLDYRQQHAMTKFGEAFDEEAKLAEQKATEANKWVFWLIGALGVVIASFVFIECAGWGLASGETREVWRWSLLRVSVVAFCAWFIGHSFRERRNFLHVAVANRHRRNICNAYVAFAEKMTPEERAKYLEVIIPTLSSLGKTGFITKEEVPDMPGGQLFKACLEGLKEAKKAK